MYTEYVLVEQQSKRGLSGVLPKYSRGNLDHFPLCASLVPISFFG